MKYMQRVRQFTSAAPQRRREACLCGWVGCAAIAIALGAGLLSGFAQSLAQSASLPPQAAIAPPNAKGQVTQASLPAAQGEAPGKNGAQAKRAVIDSQKQELANQCAQLLKMATALKTEVDKTTKDTLSIPVVREAGEIEQLAHRARAGTGKS